MGKRMDIYCNGEKNREGTRIEVWLPSIFIIVYVLLILWLNRFIRIQKIIPKAVDQLMNLKSCFAFIFCKTDRRFIGS